MTSNKYFNLKQNRIHVKNIKLWSFIPILDRKDRYPKEQYFDRLWRIFERGLECVDSFMKRGSIL